MAQPKSKHVTKRAQYGWDDTNKDWVALAATASGGLVIDVSETPATSVGTGKTTVTTAGTPVQMPDVSVKRVKIQCPTSNTGRYVAVGDASVDASAEQGVLLFKSQNEWFEVGNLNLLYIDSLSNGDFVTYYYEEA